MTKEEKSELNRRYRLKNADHNKKWRAANKERKQAYGRAERKRHKQPFYIVYCIPNEEPPYVGKTHSPSMRMAHHKSRGKDLGEEGDEWFILDVCMTNREALDI